MDAGVCSAFKWNVIRGFWRWKLHPLVCAKWCISETRWKLIVFGNVFLGNWSWMMVMEGWCMGVVCKGMEGGGKELTLPRAIWKCPLTRFCTTCCIVRQCFWLTHSNHCFLLNWVSGQCVSFTRLVSPRYKQHYWTIRWPNGLLGRAYISINSVQAKLWTDSNVQCLIRHYVLKRHRKLVEIIIMLLLFAMWRDEYWRERHCLHVYFVFIFS